MNSKKLTLLFICLLLITPWGPLSVTSSQLAFAEELEEGREQIVFIEEEKETSIILSLVLDSLSIEESLIESVQFYHDEEQFENVYNLEENRYELEGVSIEQLAQFVFVLLGEEGEELATIHMEDEWLEEEELVKQEVSDDPNAEEAVQEEQENVESERDLAEVEAEPAMEAEPEVETAEAAEEEELAHALRYGDQSQDVTKLKEYLAILGYQSNDQPVEYFGKSTEESVEQFQSDYERNVTGEVDEETFEFIEELATGPLRQGMYREDVIELKIHLVQNGHGVSSTPTTYFGPITDRQLRAFQQQAGLEPDGIAGSDTLQALETMRFENLWVGMYDERVIVLKQMLAKKGYGVSSNPTTYFGPITERQVTAFQKDYGFPENGVVTNDVWEKLRDLTSFKNGDRHPDIVQLKRYLAVLGYEVTSSPTQLYGSITARMVSEFQEDYGLPVTGEADLLTIAVLTDEATGPLKNGMYRDDARTLKINLEKVGFKVSNTPTIYFGPSTHQAVVAFQETYGLTADGIVGHQTASLLNELARGSLYVGLRDSKVIELKQHLAILGYGVSDTPTSLYGSITESMVSEFQRDFNLPVTGAADSRTQKVLKDRATGPLQEGMYRDDVVTLKIMLDQAGFKVSNSNTNFFGSITTSRLKEFQAFANLSQTGIVDAATLAELQKYSTRLFNGSRHADVIDFKLDLERAGFKVSNNPTNYFGPSTEEKVKAFQRRYGLLQTGIGDEATLAMLKRVINNEVARTVSSIVDGSRTYSYSQMRSDIERLEFFYPGLIETRVIGRSVDGRNIYAIKLGHGSKEVMFNGSHHAREHMTTNVLMKMVDDYAKAYAGHNSYGGYNVRTVLNNVSIWFVPMLNPDGVMLVQQGANSARNPSQAIVLNNGSTNFQGWKANIRGVDLNRQYPALWNTITNNPGRPGPANYKGTAPLTEPEAKALYDFTLSRNFMTAISYHSSGEVIYARYNQEPYTQRIAQGVANITGYSPINLQHSQSGGGFTDWFILNRKRPGLTPEISPFVGDRPVPLSNWSRVWNQNRTVGLYIANEARTR
ncbi:peptidoglycan-binding protein [Halalkalibacter krulwichiae]|uniref:Gamma-D-glutamyl-L-diamino acid endopeptidase 1 n=1 Tax=Halalkalibacter krulwichiae TaxID=199441 RepID=A0A1X9MM83_9BACI|nr:peptidoglycan-binding protein [Halalkalibacter krulwichiae]ARK32202.1 Gamma-D-glutamyl-L-diamino acid endopeptidase 1 [Halalkalibacter krulwichiae]